MTDLVTGTSYYLMHNHFDAALYSSAGGNSIPCRHHFQVSAGLTDSALLTDDFIRPCRQQLRDTVLTPADDTAIMDWIVKQTTLPASSFLCIRDEKNRGLIRSDTGADTRCQQIQIQAAHHLPLVPAGHRCHRVHGHNYQLTLYAASERDVLAEATDALRQKLDQSYLNDIPGLNNPTCEKLALWIWEHPRTRAARLTGVAVQETVSSGCYYDGNFHIWRDMHFESAWRVPTKRGAQIRGGRLLLRVYVTLPLCMEKGWTVDFAEIKQCLAPLHEELDHHMLSDIPALASDAEADLFPWLCNRLPLLLPATTRVEMRQGPTTGRMMSHGQAIPPMPV